MRPTTPLSALLLCLLASLTAACNAELTAGGQQVRVGKMEPQNCKELGTVYGSGGGANYTSSESKLRGAQNDIRNRTADMGGNYVAMDAASSDVNGMSLAGRAFKCDSAPVTPAPAAAPEGPTAEERLVKLKALREKNLITDQDYETRRSEILKSL